MNTTVSKSTATGTSAISDLIGKVIDKFDTNNDKQLNANEFGSFLRGLRLNPRHAGLIGEIRRLGLRRKPVVQFFSRSHPVNRILGRLRGRLARPASGRSRPMSPTGS